MSAGEFTVRPDSFPPSAQELRTAAQNLVAAWQPVAQQTQSVRFGAGYDMVSPLVQVSLQGALSLVDSCVQSSAEALGEFADGLESMGRIYDSVEQDTTALMTAE
ncbi:hypothetical protein [Jatrophihabitans fulvus]